VLASGQGTHERDGLSYGIGIDVPAMYDRHVNVVESFPTDLRLRHALLFRAALQHPVMTRLDVDLLPNHRSRFHTSQYTSF
jgi:hypothetical protein